MTLELSAAQKKHYRSIGHNLKPVVMINEDKGVSEGVSFVVEPVWQPETGRFTRGEWSRHSDLNRGPAVYECRGAGVGRASITVRIPTVAAHHGVGTPIRCPASPTRLR